MSILSTLNKLTGKKDKNVLAALNSLTHKTADDIEEAMGNLGSGGGGSSEFGRTVLINANNMYLDSCPADDLSDVQDEGNLEGQHRTTKYGASFYTMYISTEPNDVYPYSEMPGMLLCTEGMDGYPGFMMGYDGDLYAAGGLYVSIELYTQGSKISTVHEWDPETYPDQRAVLLYKGHPSGNDSIWARDVTDCISAGVSSGETMTGALLIHVPMYDINPGDDWCTATLYIYGLGAVPGE